MYMCGDGDLVLALCHRVAFTATTHDEPEAVLNPILVLAVFSALCGCFMTPQNNITLFINERPIDVTSVSMLWSTIVQSNREIFWLIHAWSCCLLSPLRPHGWAQGDGPSLPPFRHLWQGDSADLVASLFPHLVGAAGLSDPDRRSAGPRELALPIVWCALSSAAVLEDGARCLPRVGFLITEASHVRLHTFVSVPFLPLHAPPLRLGVVTKGLPGSYPEFCGARGRCLKP